MTAKARTMRLQVKICGINSKEALAAAVDGGARYIGLVFYAPSPRFVTAREGASLAARIPAEVMKVGLFVDADDTTIEETLKRCPLDMLQFHGAESPERVREANEGFGLPVMKAMKLAGANDLAVARDYVEAADRLLFDAKPPADMKDALPGGNALALDWNLLKGTEWPCPWMLSGGLNADNLAEAVETSGAEAVDVSSGVEDRPGHKDPARIRAYLNTAAKL